MSGDETLQKRAEDSDSEEEDEPEEPTIPVIDIDISNLHPLSPEVISKQVRILYEWHVDRHLLLGSERLLVFVGNGEHRYV